MAVQSVGVIGAGQMGNGIAHVFALAGYEVLLNDISAEAMQAAVATIDKNLDRQVSRGKVSAEDKAAIETAIADLKGVLESDDAEVIKEKTSTLAEASMKLGEAMYKASQAEAEAKASGTADEDDDVVDADFEEVKDDDKK